MPMFMGAKDSMKVSIIINSLNCEKYLKEAIDSVYAQTYPTWEVIFWDKETLRE
jgi:glycosyltransferase involved in cell wall biosynthesis